MYACMGVCMLSYEFRRAFMYRPETWHGARKRAHGVLGHIFRSDPTQGQQSSRGQVAFEMPYGIQNW